ncbi:hypothetical protein GGF37_002494 [Kickxella alabastrina]|nr:hypothetical protein GGF37_002494 [Kickxella alabastrina]
MVPDIQNISISWPNFVFQQTDRGFGKLMSNVTGSTNLPTVIDPLGFSGITHLTQIIEATNTSTTIRVFKSAGDLSANVLLDGISSLAIFASVQTIDIACCHLEFADIITILRYAPFIRSLHCAAAICVPKIKGMHRDELPEYMCITGKQFGKHFGFLTVIDNKLGQAAHLVETIALVVIAFSQRVRFTLICNDMSGFSTGTKTIVDSEPFAKYVNQIEAFTRHN